MKAKEIKVVRVSVLDPKDLDNEINKFLIKNEDMEIVDIKPISEHSALIIHK